LRDYQQALSLAFAWPLSVKEKRKLSHVSGAGLRFDVWVIDRLPGQQTTGAIRGTVTDPSGSLISGVLISATNDQTRATQTTKTNANGAYVLPLLPPGVYVVSAEIAGFAKAVRNNVLVRITETESVDFAVQLGSVTESVTVAGSVSLIQSETSSVGRALSSRRSRVAAATRNTQLLGLLRGGVGPAQRRADRLRARRTERHRFVPRSNNHRRRERKQEPDE
jgi:hypothetical protein